MVYLAPWYWREALGLYFLANTNLLFARLENIFVFLNKGSVVANVIVISQSSTKYFMEVFLFHENF